jgi:hypothetical protein
MDTYDSHLPVEEAETQVAEVTGTGTQSSEVVSQGLNPGSLVHCMMDVCLFGKAS